jgi:hypothetical protein
MSDRTVLGLVNRLKIEQDNATQKFADAERLIHEAQQHLDRAAATLTELAVIQGIVTPESHPYNGRGETRELLTTSGHGTGPERIMS